MNGFSAFFFFALFLLLSQREAKATQLENHGIYIVYTGAASSRSSGHHHLLLSSLSSREKKTVRHSYKNGFSGFAAHLSEEEAQSIARMPGVVSVFPDPILQLHTTRSWDFLYQMDREMGLIPTSSNSSSHGVDTIIGIIDTGIWPESEAFNDIGMGPIPSRWKGTCMSGHAFHSSNCNRKLIGARYYANPESSSITTNSPRDYDGHGTHVAAISAGSPIKGASFNGLVKGTAKGGSPGSRIAVYRACDKNGCRGSDVLKAMDDAIADGVDIISLSSGISFDGGDFPNDPIAIGAFHATEKGILVVCSAGDLYDSEYYNSVVNVAPWILTVGATTIDRDFETNVLLGGNKLIKGGSINLANSLQKDPIYPLITGDSAANSSSPDAGEAGNCLREALDENKVKGKIVVCSNFDRRRTEYKLEGLTSLGAIGMILLYGNEKNVPSVYKSPMADIDSGDDGHTVYSYATSTRNPRATILPTTTVFREKPAPSLALFSGRGPARITTNILKPDIVAPGVSILAAWRGINSEKGRTSNFNVLSGTSMACPHVSAIAAIVKSQNPTWSPSAIKSAIMTTAIQTNNMKGPISVDGTVAATPYDIGAGQVSLSAPLQPGFVYDMGISDYLQFLCNKGYNISTIKLISLLVPSTFSCPSNSNIDLVSNMNYPTISIAYTYLKDKKIVKVSRTVTSVSEDESIYTATIDTPKGLEVKVTPNKLQFTKRKKKLSYVLTFNLTVTDLGDMFGSITWSNKKYKVRSPFVVD